MKRTRHNGRRFDPKQTLSVIVTTLLLAGSCVSIVAFADAVAAKPGQKTLDWRHVPASGAQVGQFVAFPGTVLDSSAGLADLFASADLDRSGTLEITEAMFFFQWVEENIQYRWDDENAPGHTYGFEVGDGRPGTEYLQTPQQTFSERRGDCEDQHAFELAFYQHWNILGFLAFVNTQAGSPVDHAIAIIYGAPTLPEFDALLGDVPYYEALGRPGIPDGFYFIVDNTYSSVFGQVSVGITTDQLVIHHVASLDDLYGSQWVLRAAAAT